MPTKLYHGRVANAAGLLATPANRTQIASAVVTNTTGASVDLTLWAFSSGSSGDTNIILGPKAIPANTTVSLTEIVAMAIDASEAIHGLADVANALTIRLSGSA